jgi:hypothetical protein
MLEERREKDSNNKVEIYIYGAVLHLKSKLSLTTLDCGSLGNSDSRDV